MSSHLVFMLVTLLANASPLQHVSTLPQYDYEYSITVTTEEECQEAREDYLQLPWTIRGNATVMGITCSKRFPGAFPQ